MRERMTEERLNQLDKIPYMDMDLLYKEEALAEIRASWAENERLRGEIAEARQQLAEAYRKMTDHGPGTPLGRLGVMANFAEKRCSHNPVSARGFENSIIAHIDKLERELAEARRVLALFCDPSIICTCHEAYRIRELRDPGCHYHNWDSEIDEGRKVLDAARSAK